MKKIFFSIISIVLAQTFYFSSGNKIINLPDITIPYILFKVNSTQTFWEKSEKQNYSVPPQEVIDILYRILVDNPTMKMQITGHCDFSEKNKGNLSLARAQYVIDKVIKKGISKDRLVAKGLGVESPLVKSDTIKNAKTKEEKESLRQQNRRVVFSVLVG